MDKVEQRIADIDAILDEYEQKIGLPKYDENHPGNSEIKSYLSFTRQQIENLSPQDAGSISYMLSQYALFLQRAINRENSRIKWAESVIKEIISDRLDSYSGYGYAEKFGKAVKDNEYALKLSQIQRGAQQRADRLNFVANSINSLSNILLNIMRLKKE